MSGIFKAQLAALIERFGAVEATTLPSGAVLVTAPGIALPAGWSASTTTVRFLAPLGYPQAAPDCFWADNGLRLAGGAMPASSGNNNIIPETSIPGLWFSWHVQDRWDPNRDTLISWMNTIIDRLRRAL
jgi:hypothetical protein